MAMSEVSEMPDFLTKEERSHRMSLIRSKDTKCELKMASILREADIRYRRHAKLPGTPDFVINKRIALFVDGDFWHGRHFWDRRHKLAPFWFNKILRNMERDREVDRKLRRHGMTVLHVWETDLRHPKKIIQRIRRAIRRLS